MSRVDRMTASENPQEQLRREADHLRKIIDDISGRIRTYENNLGFFKNTKGSNLMDEVQQKVEAEKSKLAEFTAKRKMVQEELSRLSRQEKAKAEA